MARGRRWWGGGGKPEALRHRKAPLALGFPGNWNPRTNRIRPCLMFPNGLPFPIWKPSWARTVYFVQSTCKSTTFPSYLYGYRGSSSINASEIPSPPFTRPTSSRVLTATSNLSASSISIQVTPIHATFASLRPRIYYAGHAPRHGVGVQTARSHRVKLEARTMSRSFFVGGGA